FDECFLTLSLSHLLSHFNYSGTVGKRSRSLESDQLLGVMPWRGKPPPAALLKRDSMRFNLDMAKTRKELAFLRDLYIQDEWTRRFTELVDKHLDLNGSKNLLYLNSGTGGHVLALDEKYGKKTDIFASAENEDLLTISRDKGAAVRT